MKDLPLIEHPYFRPALFVLMLLPTLGVALWAIGPTFRAIVAAYALTPVVVPSAPMDAMAWVDFRRQMQKHFSQYDVHVPMEDMVIQDAGLSGAELTQFTRKACGDGLLYVWIPLRVTLPVWGTIVWDWCWVPRIKREA